MPPPDPDSLLHEHDQWNDQKQFAMRLTGDGLVEANWASLGRQSSGSLGWLVDIAPSTNHEKPASIPAGTGRLEIKLSWEGTGLDASFGELHPTVCLQNSDGASASQGICNFDIRNGTHAYRTSGETWVIREGERGGQHGRPGAVNGDAAILNNRTVDAPHASKSNWRFELLPCDRFGTSLVNQVLISQHCNIPNHGVTRFKLELTIFRNDRPLTQDPSHNLYWKDGRTNMTVLSSQTVTQGDRYLPAQQWRAEATGETRVPPFFSIGAGYILGAVKRQQSEMPIIPQGTGRVEIKLSWTGEDLGPLHLRYQTALTSWSTWQQGQPASCGTNCQKYVITLRPPAGEADYALHTDSPYAKSTLWAFGIFFDDDYPKAARNYAVHASIEVFREGA